MFDIKLDYNNIKITSVEKEDIKGIYQWITLQKKICVKNENMENIDYSEFYDRFLEYYFSECEFFLKVKKDDKLIGVLKGRTEFKNPNEVWIKYFLLDKGMRNNRIGSKILELLLKYFLCDCGIYNFYTTVQKEDYKCLSFLEKNKFYIAETLKKNNSEVTILKKHMLKT
ncbi:GNAT family N-acetyltransferase [Clostridium massiliodielmoense]|uniref:GNAT family N-acetyltransferase n=1 Tax=Clostridium massiliodielmoense TaxID=1776385 RepID=UPI000A26F668|nr:GNAT family N-acetyltransferase [Clostridium massiliodielmoense]